MAARIIGEIKNEEKEMRAVFAEVMDDLASKDDRVIYFDADLMNSIGMVGFSQKHPDRTFNLRHTRSEYDRSSSGCICCRHDPFCTFIWVFCHKKSI